MERRCYINIWNDVVISIYGILLCIVLALIYYIYIYIYVKSRNKSDY